MRPTSAVGSRVMTVNDRNVSPGGLWLSEEVEQPKPQPAHAPAAKKPAAPAAAKGKAKKQAQAEEEWGLVVSGLGLQSKRDAAAFDIDRFPFGT